jgi:hypothetical protein
MRKKRNIEQEENLDVTRSIVVEGLALFLENSGVGLQEVLALHTLAKKLRYEVAFVG